jgi:hypothetical protein
MARTWNIKNSTHLKTTRHRTIKKTQITLSIAVDQQNTRRLRRNGATDAEADVRLIIF